MLKAVIFVCAIASLCIHSSESKSIGDVEVPSNVTSFLELSQALKYGDDCSWEAEQSRQNYVKQLLSGNLQVFKTMTAEFLEKGYKLCSAAQLFVCDKETEKCACGDPGYEWKNGVNRELYALEGKRTCRWNTNTYCTSEEFLSESSQVGVISDSKCKTGTTCKIADGNVCSKTEMMRYLFKNYDLKVLSNFKSLAEKMTTGEVCSCKADKLEDENDSNSYQYSVPNSDNQEGSESTTRIHLLKDEDVNSKSGDENSHLYRPKRSALTDDFDTLVKFVVGPSAITSY